MLREIQIITTVMMRLRVATLTAVARNTGHAVLTRVAALRCLCLLAPLEVTLGKTSGEKRRAVRDFYKI